MPAPPLANTFECGTDGVTISGANSGGVCGDAFSAVNGSPLFSNNVHGRGSICAQAVDAAGTTTVNWTGLGGITTPNPVYSRFYMYIAAIPTGADYKPMRHLTAAAAACASVGIHITDGVVRGILASGGIAAGSTGTIQVALNQWVRIETRVIASTTVGEIEWRLYNSPDSVTITETKNATGLVLGADIGAANFLTIATTPTTPYTAAVKDVAVATAGWIGPSVPDPSIIKTGIGVIGKI